jgi:hypothetical protein
MLNNEVGGDAEGLCAPRGSRVEKSEFRRKKAEVRKSWRWNGRRIVRLIQGALPTSKIYLLTSFVHPEGVAWRSQNSEVRRQKYERAGDAIAAESSGCSAPALPTSKIYLLPSNFLCAPRGSPCPPTCPPSFWRKTFCVVGGERPLI